MLVKLFEESWIKHFTVNEVLKASNTKQYSENDIPENLIKNIVPTIRILDALREELNKPIILNCTYRDDEHNRKVGGEKNSLHKKFNAIDFRINGSFRELKELYNHLVYWDSIRHFNFISKTGGMGLGLYNTFIHIDTRSILGLKTPARWNEVK